MGITSNSKPSVPRPALPDARYESMFRKASFLNRNALQNIVDRNGNNLESLGYRGVCGLSANNTARLIENMSGNELKVVKHQTRILFGGDIGHAFGITKLPSGSVYLLDGTFSQFLHADLSRTAGKLLGQDPLLGKIAEQLTVDGFLKLDEASLESYSSMFVRQGTDHRHIKPLSLYEKGTLDETSGTASLDMGRTCGHIGKAPEGTDLGSYSFYVFLMLNGREESLRLTAPARIIPVSELKDW